MSSAAAPIANQVIALVAQKFNSELCALSPRTDLKRDLGADSLDMVELLILLENEFSVDIPDEDAEGITTVQQMIDYLVQHHDRCSCYDCLVAQARRAHRKV